MRERADADHVDPERRELRDARERDASGSLEQRATLVDGDGALHHGVVEVVEQHDVGAGRERLLELLERIDFTLDPGGVGRVLAAPADRLRHPSCRRHVVVFDQHGGAQVVAMVVPATCTYGATLERA